MPIVWSDLPPAVRLFGTALAEWVLNRAVHTRPGEEQAEQVGGRATTIGKPEMRIKMVPILGQMFGGNYAFLIWTKATRSGAQRWSIRPIRRSCCVPPMPMPSRLKSSSRRTGTGTTPGNRALAMALKGLEVVASAEERGRTPAVTRRLADLEEITLGDLVVRGHAVPGHTREHGL